MRKRTTHAYLTLTALLVFSYLLMLPETVFAGDAVSDVMNSDRFTGAISSIEWLTVRVDYWFTMVITATGFFIISASLLKNVCAGAYCSNHKFWDKVAEAHEKSESIQLSQLFGGGIKDKFMNLSTSGVKDMILCIIPNIKSFTDFDDADIEPKQYWTKAIPQMLGCIMIGVFVYNGYYRDTAASVGSFGSEICRRVFSSVDPAAWVDKLTQTTGTPDSIYEGDNTLKGKALAQISKQLYKSYLSVAKNLSSTEDKTSLMRDCELNAETILNDPDIDDKYFDDSKRNYDFALTNLAITLCPVSSTNNLGKLKCTALDKDTSSVDQFVGYFAFTSSVITNGQVPAEKSCYHIAFQFKGSQKTSTTGLTKIVASAGGGTAALANTTTIQRPGEVEQMPNQSGKYQIKSSCTKDTLFTQGAWKANAVAAVRTKHEDAPTNINDYNFTGWGIRSGWWGQNGNSGISNPMELTGDGCIDWDLKAYVTVEWKNEQGAVSSETVDLPIKMHFTLQ